MSEAKHTPGPYPAARVAGLKRHERTLEASPSHRGKNRRKQIGVSLDRDTMAEIDAAADRAGITRTEWIRERLEWALLDMKEGRA